MRILVLTSLIVLFSCESEEQVDIPAINKDYSLELENSIRTTNERISENINFSYWQVDVVRARQTVYGNVPNFESVDSSVFELREFCSRFRKNIDSTLTYNSFELNSFIESVEEFKQEVNSIVFHYPLDYPEDYYLQIDKILNSEDFNHFGNLSENKFRVEKEMFKGRILEVEQVAIQKLLTAFRYESCK
ncbi:hypothetical protein K6119_10665 [Paracrocinitomix mangrovi]|uniref:hypothetical protein n=1 Tax=Paracrocinitomix mangrovi TaxID=2862509 RepID=UPI001C8F08BC|nr:hypothetical protein [Paracrocinitomix mangrovi]UKN00194.1 hypothetical protein K6119_10665 [Paracrocinitomix mangrovi]